MTMTRTTKTIGGESRKKAGTGTGTAAVFRKIEAFIQ